MVISELPIHYVLKIFLVQRLLYIHFSQFSLMLIIHMTFIYYLQQNTNNTYIISTFHIFLILKSQVIFVLLCEYMHLTGDRILISKFLFSGTVIKKREMLCNEYNSSCAISVINHWRSSWWSYECNYIICNGAVKIKIRNLETLIYVV